jgi:hypothetical protein
LPLAVTLYRFAALFLVFAFAPGLPHVVTTAEGATDFATGADVIRGSGAKGTNVCARACSSALKRRRSLTVNLLYCISSLMSFRQVRGTRVPSYFRTLHVRVLYTYTYTYTYSTSTTYCTGPSHFFFFFFFFHIANVLLPSKVGPTFESTKVHYTYTYCTCTLSKFSIGQSGLKFAFIANHRDRPPYSPNPELQP